MDARTLLTRCLCLSRARRGRRRGGGLAGGRRERCGWWRGCCCRRARSSRGRGRSPTSRRSQSRCESLGRYERRKGRRWGFGGSQRRGWSVEFDSGHKGRGRNCTGSHGRGRGDAIRRTANGNKTGAVTRKSHQYDSDEHCIKRLAPTQRFEREVHQAGGSMISGMKYAFKEARPALGS